MKNLFQNPFLWALLILLAAFAAIIYGSRYIIGLFTDSASAWLIILVVLLVALVLMRFRRTLTPHEVQDRLLQIVEPPVFRDARLKGKSKPDEPANQ